jgi:hypothetical protein
MPIQNYGLFWRRNDVFWGKPKVSGHLKGYPAREAFRVVDFREQQGSTAFMTMDLSSSTLVRRGQTITSGYLFDLDNIPKMRLLTVGLAFLGTECAG